MVRSLLVNFFIIISLVGCQDKKKDKAVHRPAIPFTYTILNETVISDGKDSATCMKEPFFEVNDIVYIHDDGTPWRIRQIISNRNFRHIVLPFPGDYVSKDLSDPNIFKVHHNGDTLFLRQAKPLPYFQLAPDNYTDFKLAKAIDPETGEVVSLKVNNNVSVGDSINGYTLLQLSPFTETLGVELPDEIELISSDPKNPDTMQAYQLYKGNIKLGFYHSKQ